MVLDELELESLLFVSEDFVGLSDFVELSDFVVESDVLLEESDVLVPSESGFLAPLLPLP